MRKILIASMITGVVLALSGAAVAGGPGRHGGGHGGHGGMHFKHAEGGAPHIRFEHGHMDQMAEKLGLTEDQKEAAKKIHEEARNRSEPLMEQHHEQMEEIHSLLDAGTANATEIGEKMIAAHATGKQLRAVHEETKASFAALLTSEQRAKLEEMEEDMPRHHRRIMRF